MTTATNSNTGKMIVFVGLFIVGTFALIFLHGIIAPGFIENALGKPSDFGTAIDSTLLPQGVDEAYINAAGEVLVVASANGFNGPVVFSVQMDADGRYVKIIMGANNETEGGGSLVGEEDYLSNYYGLNDPNSVDALSGASYTSKALKTVLGLANETYNAIT